MKYSFHMVLLATTLGCQKPGNSSTERMSDADSGDMDNDPTEHLGSMELSSFRELRKTTLTNADRPTRLALDTLHGPALILDTNAAHVWATNALFLHDPRSVCIDNTNVRNSTAPGRNGLCPPGTDKTSRGAIETTHPPIAISMIKGEGRAGILDSRGQLHWLITDPIATNAKDFMRPSAGPLLPFAEGLDEDAILRITDAEVGVATGSMLSVFTHDGIRIQTFETDSPIQDIEHHGNDWWILTTENTYQNDHIVGHGGVGLLIENDNIWVASSDTVTRIGGVSLDLTGALGPTALWGSTPLILTAHGISAIHDDAHDSIWEGNAVDFAVNEAQELVILEEDGSIRVVVNETLYSMDTRLFTWISTFIEKPRNPDSTVPCRGEGETLSSILDTAATNLQLLMDLPATTALGITPSHWSRALQCDEESQLSELVDQLDLGILFHHAPSECEGNQSCYEQALQEDLNTFTVPPTWSSGLGAHTELEIDWVQALRAINAPNRFAFFGLSVRPDVPHDGDIRAKNSWPSTVTGSSHTWAVDEVSEISDTTQEGWLHMLPGDNVPAFNLGGCANLFLNECHPLGRGNGGELNDEDIRSLDILLHRALFSADSSLRYTWNFHLPDIGVYDYTNDCTVQDGIWTGESCEGARIQTWLNEVHQRFVSRDYVVWTTPGGMAL